MFIIYVLYNILSWYDKNIRSINYFLSVKIRKYINDNAIII